MTPSVQKLLTDTDAKIATLDALIASTNLNIDQINSNSDVGSTNIVKNNVSTDNISTNYLIDLLLIADQSNQFICVANDTMSRVVDVFLYVNSNTINTTVNSDITNLIVKQQELVTYLDTRLSNLTIDDVNITISSINTIQLEIDNLFNSLVTKLYNLQNLVVKTLNVLDVFQDILGVNAAVGVALSVSKQAWEELKIMSLLEYDHTVTTTPMVESTEILNDIESSTFINDAGLGTIHTTFLKYFPQLFLKEKLYKGSIYDYLVINDVDLVPTSPVLDSNYGKLTSSEILNIQRIDPVQLNIIFEQIAFMENLDLSDITLQTFYDNIPFPTIAFDEFKASFSTIEFLNIFDKFNHGLSSSALLEYIQNYNIKLQYSMIQSTLDLFYLTKDGIAFMDEMVIGESIFVGSYDINFSTYVNQFLREQFEVFKGTSTNFNRKNTLRDEYKTASITKDLVLEQQSGKIKIKQFKDSKLTKNVSTMDYKYIKYSDDIQIYYIEGTINNINFLIKDQTLTLYYNIVSENKSNLEFVVSEDRKILTDYSMSGYLINGLNTEHQLNLIKLIEDNNKISSLKAVGQEIKEVIKLFSEFDSVSNKYTLTNQVTKTETDTTFISDNGRDRIATNVTNVYREELINDRLSFSQARVRSIVSSLRHLGYRKVLDDYITLTWDSNIPHPKRGI